MTGEPEVIPTPLFLLGVGVFRKLTGERDFLEEAVSRSLTQMEYQSPSDGVPGGTATNQRLAG